MRDAAADMNDLERSRALEGARVLVVEDEMMAASMLEMIFGDCGCVILGPVPTVEQGLALASDGPIDAAILDVNLGGQPVFPIADALSARQVPFVFVTGYGAPGVDTRRYPTAAVVQKPYDDEALVRLVAEQIGAARTGR
jgi:CheY-like chemotaxis protein